MLMRAGKSCTSCVLTGGPQLRYPIGWEKFPNEIKVICKQRSAIALLDGKCDMGIAKASMQYRACFITGQCRTPLNAAFNQNWNWFIYR